jgi:hypothetical protein
LLEAPFVAGGGFDKARAVAGTIGSAYPLADNVFAAVDLTGLTEHCDAVRVLVLDGEMVEDVSVSFSGVPMSQFMMSRLWTCCST